jgi:guanylate kinase
MTKILILVGHSGSGKSFLADKLTLSNWIKMTQVTTRERRIEEPEDAYDFITDELYEEIKDNLFGRTEVNGCKYGTSKTLYLNKNHVVVLNKRGIEDFLKFKAQLPESVDIAILGLEINGKGREGRDILKETKETKEICEYLLTSNEYFEAEDILNYLKEVKGW